MTAARWAPPGTASNGDSIRAAGAGTGVGRLRALAYVASGAVLGVITLAWLPLALLAGGLIATPWLISPLVGLERRRVALLGGPAIPDPHQQPDRPGIGPWLRTRYGEVATWGELGYLAVLGTFLLVVNLAVLALPLAPLLAAGSLQLVSSGPGTAAGSGPAAAGAGTDPALVLAVVALAGLALLVLAVVTFGHVLPRVAAAHGQVARQLLWTGHQDAARKVARSRARLVDAFEVERRRIERDLHDGAQQQLLALGLTLR